MTAATVLIAAFSGRALAASALRAGYSPLVADSFGDLDTRAAAASYCSLEDAIGTGFKSRSLMSALEVLASDASTPPIGLVLGAGFEETPRLVAALSERFRLLGCPAESIRRAKDPALFFPMLERLGIPHPETRLDPPTDGTGWLTKRTGGTGGTHIARCRTRATIARHRYFQRESEGMPVSVLGVIGRKGPAFAVSRQWTNPMPRRPFRFGGAVGSVPLDADTEARLLDTAMLLASELELTGLVSFDFLLCSGGDLLLLEVNPRPGATLDVFDDAKGSLFEAHIEACLGNDSASFLMRNWAPPKARACAYLYAGHGDVCINLAEWPGWVSDRPPTGSVVSKHRPIATVSAEGDTPEAAELICRERLGALEALVYEDAKQKGAPA